MGSDHNRHVNTIHFFGLNSSFRDAASTVTHTCCATAVVVGASIISRLSSNADGRELLTPPFGFARATRRTSTPRRARQLFGKTLDTKIFAQTGKKYTREVVSCRRLLILPSLVCYWSKEVQVYLAMVHSFSPCCLLCILFFSNSMSERKKIKKIILIRICV